LLAFVEKPQDRFVEIPDDKRIDDLPIAEALELVFRYGQNDFQPKPMPSVSAGDAIYFKGSVYYVAGVGFIEITGEEIAEIRAMPQRDRAFAFIEYVQKSRKERGVPCETI